MTQYGPPPGTDEYREQVERILKFLKAQEPNVHDLDQLLLLYILDTSYARGAIAEADSTYRKKVLGLP